MPYATDATKVSVFLVDNREFILVASIIRLYTMWDNSLRKSRQVKEMGEKDET